MSCPREFKNTINKICRYKLNIVVNTSQFDNPTFSKSLVIRRKVIRNASMLPVFQSLLGVRDLRAPNHCNWQTTTCNTAKPSVDY